MADQEHVEQQQALLGTYRQTLTHLVRQAAQYGGEVNSPPSVANGITEARNNIRHIKGALRGWGIAVEDLPDEEPIATRPPEARPQRHPTPARLYLSGLGSAVISFLVGVLGNLIASWAQQDLLANTFTPPRIVAIVLLALIGLGAGVWLDQLQPLPRQRLIVFLAGGLSLALIAFVVWPLSTPPAGGQTVPTASGATIVPAQPSAPPATTETTLPTSAPTPTLWPSPTPVLADQLRVALASPAACPAVSKLANELDKLSINGRDVVVEQQDQIASMLEASLFGEGVGAQLILWETCLEGEDVELQMSFTQVPPYYELLFEPDFLIVTAHAADAQQFAIASSLYIYGEYQAAERALTLVSSDQNLELSRAFYWLKGNIAARLDAWDTALAAYEQTVSGDTASSLMELYANLGLAQLQVAMPDQPCTHRPVDSYDKAIGLAEAQTLADNQQTLALLQVGRGLAYLVCSGEDNDEVLFQRLQEAADKGKGSDSPLLYDFRAQINQVQQKSMAVVQQDACQALALDAQQPTPHRTLGLIYFQHPGLHERTRAEFETYGQLARFNWQREEARRLLSALAQQVAPPAAEPPPPGLGQCP